MESRIKIGSHVPLHRGCNLLSRFGSSPGRASNGAQTTTFYCSVLGLEAERDDGAGMWVWGLRRLEG